MRERLILFLAIQMGGTLAVGGLEDAERLRN